MSPCTVLKLVRRAVILQFASAAHVRRAFGRALSLPALPHQARFHSHDQLANSTVTTYYVIVLPRYVRPTVRQSSITRKQHYQPIAALPPFEKDHLSGCSPHVEGENLDNCLRRAGFTGPDQPIGCFVELQFSLLGALPTPRLSAFQSH
jgi:hypothetical protein